MRKLGEQWIENGRMYKAISGKFNCLGCSLDNGSVMCIHKNIVECEEGQNFIIHDLGPVNEDGVLGCPFCGEYPVLLRYKGMYYFKCISCRAITYYYNTKQEAVDACNRRAI